jgi:cellulose synthase/poly-beta-1,6-N-acetylglucosamine synthase-like glycosyltransferase
MNAGLFPLAAFWTGIAALTYTFAGYALLIRLLARFRPRSDATETDGEKPRVTAVVVAHNESAHIVARVENLLASDYPRERLRVVVVSDGSTDDTAARVRSVSDPRVSVLSRAERHGKASGVNAALAECDADLIVFGDARQRFAVDTITRLAAHFADPQVGAVSGALEIEGATSGVGGAVEAYWRHEKEIRGAEAQWDSCIGCTGAVYAIRRSLFAPIPDDTLLDDVVIPMQIATQGYRILHDATALAFDPQPLEPAAERMRKRRTLAGNFQMLFRHPAWLLPWRNRLWWQLISHKYLRIFSPAWLALVFFANVTLIGSPFYRATFALQCACYTFAILGLVFPALRNRIFTFPAGFILLNVSVVSGFLQYLYGGANLHRWDRPKAAGVPPSTPPVPHPGAD